MKVVKFGGSSLADGAQFEKVINIITRDADRRVVVPSAPGKRFSGDIKVTDLFITFAEKTISGADLSEIKQTILKRYTDILDYFKIEDATFVNMLKNELDQLNRIHYPSFDYLFAAFTGHGEYFNAQLLARILNHLGHPAKFVRPDTIGIVVNGTPRAAAIVPACYDTMQQVTLDDQVITVVPGFCAFDADGLMVTFSRGGSDITGAILARGLQADLYENFTDVSAIYTVNPNLVPNPQKIKTMTFREMRELSYAGFSVFHDEAILPVIETNVKINVKNTNDPSAPGTMIVPTSAVDEKTVSLVTGIATDARFAAIYIHRYLLNKEVGFTLKILEILAKHGVSYEHMPSGIDDMTIIFDKSLVSEEQIQAVCSEIEETVHPNELDLIPEFAIMMVVGEGMHVYHNAPAKILTALSDANINVGMINMGASEISLMLGIDTHKIDEATKIIYQQFFN